MLASRISHKGGVQAAIHTYVSFKSARIKSGKKVETGEREGEYARRRRTRRHAMMLCLRT